MWSSSPTSNSRIYCSGSLLLLFASFYLLFYGRISTTRYFLALNGPLSFSIISWLLSFRVHNLCLLLEAKSGDFLLCNFLADSWYSLVLQSGGSRGRLLRFRLWLSSVGGVPLWANSFTFLCLSFCICTVGQVIILLSEYGCEDRMS